METVTAPILGTICVATILFTVGCSNEDDDRAERDTATDSAIPPDDTAEGCGDPAEGLLMLADGRCVAETFLNPPVMEPNSEGVYEITLMPGEFEFEGQRHCGRTYNGLYPAATIETPARTGEEPRNLRIDYRNAFTRSAFRTTSSDTSCSCLDAGGEPCHPTHGSGPAHSCSCLTDSGERCHVFDFNRTNLHMHGSHVRPDYASGGGCVERDGLRCRACQGADSDDAPKECYFSDDVINHVLPGEGAQHLFRLDEDGTHHEGLHWYHPHVHGSTAIQVASGATGAWIVRGPIDQLPGLATAKERLFVVTTPPVGYPPLAEGEPCDEDHITFDEFGILGDVAERQANLINGIRRPRLLMPPGQIERWRFLHGSFLDEMFIAVFRGKDSECEELDFAAGPIPLVQIGRDGLALSRPPGDENWPFAPQFIFMSPGYRIDSLLDGGQLAHGDTLCMMAGRFLQHDTTGITDIPVGIGEPLTADDILQVVTNGDLIAIVNVTEEAGAPTGAEMPDLAAIAALAPPIELDRGAVDVEAKCAEVSQIDDADAIDQLAAFWLIFLETEGFDQCSCPDHNVNCENFEYTDRSRYPYDRTLPLSEVEHWRLMAGFDGHPFHIHINPYLVCPLPPADSGTLDALGRLFEPPFAHWRDTYLINLGRTVDVLTEYRAFTGAFVFHCHKLNHEDHGMMELIRVCDPATEPCDTLCSGGPCRWDVCADDDNACVKAVTGAQCAVDPSRCPEAALRCLPCRGDDLSCPPESRCDLETAHFDGVERCIPGCEGDAHCPEAARCADDGLCVPAPCPAPCPPGQTCVHGRCE